MKKSPAPPGAAPAVMVGLPAAHYRAGRTYRAKQPKQVGWDTSRPGQNPVFNDRSILHLGASGVQYDGTTVKLGAHYPTAPWERWHAWSGGEWLTGATQEKGSHAGQQNWAAQLTYRAWEPAVYPVLADWLLYAPGWAVWDHYRLSIVHLEPLPDFPPPHRQYPEARFEVLLYAVSGDDSPRRERPASLRLLTPVNYVGQFDGLTYQEAAEVGRWLTLGVLQNRLLPELSGITGAREQWDSAVDYFARSHRQGFLLREDAGRASIICLTCDRESSNPHDISNQYCDFCRTHHQDRARQLHQERYGVPTLDPTAPVAAPAATDVAIQAAYGALHASTSDTP